MNRYPVILFAVIFSILSGCQTGHSGPDKVTGYDFTSPDRTVILPAILHEISGLTFIDSTTVACIQDEKGILFIYDLASDEIQRQVTFFSKGDYEGITRVGDTIFVLKSDGILYEIADYKSDSITVLVCPTGISAKDNEGLCYDKYKNRLLIAPKENPLKGPGSKDRRIIYDFSLITMKLTDEPAYSFNIETLKEFAASNRIYLPLKNKKKGLSTKPVLKFRPSGISIHPLTKDIYLLSSEDYMLFVFNYEGGIKNIFLLNPLLFRQPEGITFLENGDLLISNEGQSKSPATLLRFNYHQEVIK
jgi:uncharacterized protein YjiK